VTKLTIDKKIIASQLCYTDLVYSRINKKLSLNLNRKQIEKLVLNLVSDTPVNSFKQIGKNIYVINDIAKVSITINSYTNRVITVDRL
jgi:hypothetical protein